VNRSLFGSDEKEESMKRAGHSPARAACATAPVGVGIGIDIGIGRRTVLGFGLGFVLLVALAALGCAPIEPTMRTGPGAEVTHDGLYRVDYAGFANVWAKPDAGLGRYDKIVIAKPSFHYRTVEGVRAANDGDYEVPERRRDRFEEVVTDAFEKSLAKSRFYAITTEPGPGTLLLLAAVHDIVSHIPPRATGRDNTYVSEIGEATIVLELRDSQSNEVLARAAERRAVLPSGGVVSSNSAGSTFEIRQEAGRWGTILRNQLDALHENAARETEGKP